MRQTLSVVAAFAAAICIGIVVGDGPANGFYGDPRFYQEPAPSRLIHNHFPGSYPSDEFIVTNPAGTPILKVSQTVGAMSAWNDAIRATPNSIEKYVFHYNAFDDPNANMIVHFVDGTTVDQQCGTTAGDACNDRRFPVTNVWIDSAVSTVALVTHEMGHSLAYSDQYNPDFTCNPAADTIMNSNASSCKTSITASDKGDFQVFYEPTYQSPNPTYPDTWGSTWNAVYQVGNVRVRFPSSYVAWKYYWEQQSDTNGVFLASGYNDRDVNFRDFSFSLGSRFCALSKLYNEVGYPGTRSWSFRSQYSCIGAAQSQSAGFLLSTSDRSSAFSSTLYIRITNFSGSNRNVGIFAYPNLADIGCGYATLGYLQTRECYVPLNRGAYSQLQWFAWENTTNYSYGYLDFE